MTSQPTTAAHPFPALPRIADAQDNLITDDPAWNYRSGCAAGGGMAHLRVWADSTSPVRGHLAIVTETGLGATITNSAGEIWAELAQRYPGPLVVIEHWVDEVGEDGDRLDQVAIAGRQPTWRRVWPTPATNPHHAALEEWMEACGHKLLAAARTPE
ncbi:hypothetical protein [Streptomyces sp. NPDC002758]